MASSGEITLVTREPYNDDVMSHTLKTTGRGQAGISQTKFPAKPVSSRWETPFEGRASA